MGIEENNVMKRVMIRASKLNCRLWRNNVGKAWVGRSMVLQKGKPYMPRGGERIIFDPRPFDAGLCVGSGDNIGIVKIIITPNMVGKTIGAFISVEDKTLTGKESPEQLNFARVIREWGGIAITARSEDGFEADLTAAIKY